MKEGGFVAYVYPKRAGHDFTADNRSIPSCLWRRYCKEADLLWLSGVKAILEKRLLSLRKIWKAKVLVLNHELARKKGLISDT